MMQRVLRASLQHRAAVTGVLLGALLINLLVVVRLSPPDAEATASLPVAARCQGGGPGCAEQPLIPPPVGGLPHFELPPPPVFGALTPVRPSALAAAADPPSSRFEHPPQLAIA
jgi:hypothetical protein